MVIESLSEDSWAGVGLLGTRDGTIQRFTYDCDISGGAVVEPEFQVSMCRVPVIAREAGRRAADGTRPAVIIDIRCD